MTAIMYRSEFIAWKVEMENKIERKELTPLDEANVRMFCALQAIRPCFSDDLEEENDDYEKDNSISETPVDQI